MRIADRGGSRVRAVAPGRVNLIGEHTDYSGGLVMPMAIDLATVVEATVGGDRLRLRSDAEAEAVDVELPCPRPAEVQPGWGRYPAAVAAVVGVTAGIEGTVSSTLPAGAGLSSSAALEVATALALGAQGSPREVALACQEAEHLATGVPTGIMDQLCVAAGVQDHALLIDCATLEVEPVPLPEGVEVWVVHSGQSRALVGSAYAERRDACEAAAALVGPLPEADPAAIEALEDPVLRRRARHVRSECARVRAVAAAFRSDDPAAAGLVLTDGHRSLRDDFEVSTPALDALVDALDAVPGVYGARLTGAGFGGCAVALAASGTPLEHAPAVRGLRNWRVRPSAGARLEVL